MLAEVANLCQIGGMKLWLVSRTDDWDWDEHDAAIVRAESEEHALKVVADFGLSLGSLTLKVEELPLAGKAGVVLASFNAG
jgi:hypothetical protein